MAAGHVIAYVLYRLGFYHVAVGRVNKVATLTGVSYKKMNERFAGTKKRR